MNIRDLAFCGFDETTLLTIRNDAQVAILGGKQTVSVQLPGLSSTFQVFSNPIELAKAAQYALQVLNPTTYGRPTLISEAKGYTI